MFYFPVFGVGSLSVSFSISFDQDEKRERARARSLSIPLSPPSYPPRLRYPAPPASLSLSSFPVLYFTPLFLLSHPSPHSSTTPPPILAFLLTLLSFPPPPILLQLSPLSLSSPPSTRALGLYVCAVRWLLCGWVGWWWRVPGNLISLYVAQA